MPLSYEQFVAAAVDCFQLSAPVYHFVRLGDVEQVDDHALARRFAGRPDATFLCVEVDGAGQLERLPFPDRTARTIICLGDLVGGGHAERCRPEREEPRDDARAAEQFSRLLEPGGALLLAMTQPSSGARWRASPNALERLLGPMGLTLVGWGPADSAREIVYGLGFKPPLPPGTLDACQRFAARLQRGRATGSGLRDSLRAIVSCARHALGLPQAATADAPGLTIHLRADAAHPEAGFAAQANDTALGSRLDLM